MDEQQGEATQGETKAEELNTDELATSPTPTLTNTTSEDEKIQRVPSSTTSSTASSTVVTPNELIELVKAVKFAHPDMSIRNVHREITEVMSQQKGADGSDGQYLFLKNVKLNDVKKVWKKATYRSSSSDASAGGAKKPPAATKSSKPSGSGASKAASVSTPSLPIKASASGGTIKLYTVGDGSIQTLAKNYAYRNAAEEATKARSEEDATSMQAAVETEEQIKNNYVHIFLDVPADRSGSRPHQALINFNDQSNVARSAASGEMSRAERRSQQRAAKKGGAGKSASTLPRAKTDEQGRMIVKIQVAAALEGMENVPTPMLLYNSDRTAKTFIHPPSESDDDDGGYDKIKKLIFEKGVGGALGKKGGTKGYFYSRITKRSDGSDIISVDIASGLAPAQQW